MQKASIITKGQRITHYESGKTWGYHLSCRPMSISSCQAAIFPGIPATDICLVEDSPLDLGPTFLDS